jgi:hypothetical protein
MGWDIIIAGAVFGAFTMALLVFVAVAFRK